MSAVDVAPRRAWAPAFVAANRYLGWGEPRHGVWFVGLEEADSWYDEPAEQVISRYECLGEVSPATTQLDFATLGRAGAQIRERTSQIMCAVSEAAQHVAPDERWRWYLKQRLWRVGSRTFQANLYPLGKKSLDQESWPAQFEQLFGFGPKDEAAYKAIVAVTRFPRLRARWLEDTPLATICFGKYGWDDFAKVFELVSTPREFASGKVRVYDAERVILTHFFGRDRVTADDASLVGSLLRDEWKIRIP